MKPQVVEGRRPPPCDRGIHHGLHSRVPGIRKVARGCMATNLFLRQLGPLTETGRRSRIPELSSLSFSELLDLSSTHQWDLPTDGVVSLDPQKEVFTFSHRETTWIVACSRWVQSFLFGRYTSLIALCFSFRRFLQNPVLLRWETHVDTCRDHRH